MRHVSLGLEHRETILRAGVSEAPGLPVAAFHSAGKLGGGSTAGISRMPSWRDGRRLFPVSANRGGRVLQTPHLARAIEQAQFVSDFANTEAHLFSVGFGVAFREAEFKV